MHHEIALQNVGPLAQMPGPQDAGLYHVAFEVPDRAAFCAAYQTLTEAGIRLATVDHRISWALNFEDPDGNGLEIYGDTRQRPEGSPVWHGQSLRLTPAQIQAEG